MRTTPFSFEQIEQDIHSPIDEARSRAVQLLAAEVQKDPSLGQRALPLFQRVLTTEPFQSATADAAHGVELILGRAAVRPTWLTLLAHPSPNVVASAALYLKHPDYAQPLIDCLRRRSEPIVRACIASALGHIRDPIVLPVLIELLSDPSVRVAAIDALSDLNDPAALPYLRPLEADTTDAREDDRGCMVSVGAVAGYAVRKLEYQGIPMSASSDGKPEPHPMAAYLPPVHPIPLAVPADQPHAATASCWSRFTPYMPMALGLFEIPWAILVLILSYDPQGGPGRTPQQTHALDFVAALPALVGLLFGFYALLRGHVRGGVAWTCVLIGSIMCGLAVFVFGLEFFN